MVNPASCISARPVSEPEPAPPATSPVPTAESVFGPNLFLENPVATLPDGRLYPYNPVWFATPETAAKVAQLLGGKVVAQNCFTGENNISCQLQPNQMVQMPNGGLLNAGLVVNLYMHGYSQSYIDARVQDMITGIDTE